MVLKVIVSSSRSLAGGRRRPRTSCSSTATCRRGPSARCWPRTRQWSNSRSTSVARGAFWSTCRFCNPLWIRARALRSTVSWTVRTPCSTCALVSRCPLLARLLPGLLERAVCALEKFPSSSASTLAAFSENPFPECMSRPRRLTSSMDTLGKSRQPSLTFFGVQMPVHGVPGTGSHTTTHSTLCGRWLRRARCWWRVRHSSPSWCCQVEFGQRSGSLTRDFYLSCCVPLVWAAPLRGTTRTCRR
mmetsp:Transcript_17282/g.46829  ORF Transcript_17282/g.46829 Transcript_17282/m.46829 type:complete len:245 (+) Transcript_17282:2822-3556(+)